MAYWQYSMSVVFLWDHLNSLCPALQRSLHPSSPHNQSHVLTPGFSPQSIMCAHTPVLPIIDHMTSYPVLPTIHHMCSHPILPTINHIVISEHHNDLLVSKIYKVWWPLQFYLEYKISWLKHMKATTKGHSLPKPRCAVATLFHFLLEKSELRKWPLRLRLFYSLSHLPKARYWKVKA